MKLKVTQVYGISPTMLIKQTLKFFFVDKKYQAELNVYFVKNKYQAKWKSNNKKQFYFDYL